jgi:dipeptidyl aminopeptidase/acylaminoacyl peptidase
MLPVEDKFEYNNWPSLPRPDLKPPAGWSLSLLASISRVRDHRLSPDGTHIAFICDQSDLSDIYILPTSGGWPRRMTFDREPVVYWKDEIPQWSPDGQWLAFSMNGHVYVAPAKGGLPEKITGFTDGASTPVWMPDSNRLLVTVERDETTQVLLTDTTGSWPRALLPGPGDAWDPRPSPDGKKIAYVHRPHDDLRRLEICLLDVASGAVKSLHGKPATRDWSPRWSPDGSQIAFLSQRSGYDEVWLVHPDGDGLRQLSREEHDSAWISWSPDGMQLARTVNHGGAFDLALIDAQTGQSASIRSGKGVFSNPNWSPDGEWLTVEYESPTEPPDLYRVDLPGGTMTQLTFSKPPALANNALVIPELVGYKSKDGSEISAFLFNAPRPSGAAILYPHGGPADQYTYSWDLFAQYLIAKGYTYLAPNYRGSTGYGTAFEHASYGAWGIEDTQDCLCGGSYLAGLAGIDREKIGIHGGSYGGYLVACCLARDPEYRFACGVSRYGDADVMTSWAGCNRDLRLYTERMIGNPSLSSQIYRLASPIHEVERIRNPVLLLHGLLDDIVPPQSSEEFAQALRRHGKTFEYKTYGQEPHGFLQRANLLDSFQRTERFFDWYLMPKPHGG